MYSTLCCKVYARDNAWCFLTQYFMHRRCCDTLCTKTQQNTVRLFISRSCGYHGLERQIWRRGLTLSPQRPVSWRSGRTGIAACSFCRCMYVVLHRALAEFIKAHRSARSADSADSSGARPRAASSIVRLTGGLHVEAVVCPYVVCVCTSVWMSAMYVCTDMYEMRGSPVFCGKGFPSFVGAGLR
jgi:hypothetical protein